LHDLPILWLRYLRDDGVAGLALSADLQKSEADPAVPGPWAFALAAAVAVGAYAYGLDSINAPTIGDESLYIQITRVTAASGRWLPLLSESGITDTKPPFLFWQGILSTGWGAAWDLWHLRLPIAVTSLLTALAAGLLATRIAGRAAGLRAGLVFLGFLSTIQHGRPFLTNAAETLFLFLPLLLVHRRERTGPLLALACGISFGAAGLFKAFFLVVPGVFSLALVLLRRDGWELRPFLRRRLGFLAVASIVGLAAFGLWPLLDPRPDQVWSQFVLAESARKLKFSTFVSGLFSGEDALWEIWLGDLKNAGIYLLLLLALLRDLWRRRRALSADEQELWLYVLAFLVVYSLPTQRQANYLLPSMAALAVLLALRWDELPQLAFRATLVVLAVAGLGLPAFEWLIARRLGASPFGVAAVVLPVALGLLAVAGVRWPRFGREALPCLALVALAAGSAVVIPFARPFPASALAEVRGRLVLVPDRFLQTQERYRFLLPGADVRGYPCPGGPVRCKAPDPGAGSHATLYLDAGEPLPPGWEEVAERPHFKGRHTTAQILEIIGGRTELLVERLVLARPR
jgi:4-amino-4-deoxy-L-arabinose transferase-like glycosyltransferase